MNKESNQQNLILIIETLHTEKQEPSKRIEKKSYSNRNTIHPNTTEPSQEPRLENRLGRN